MRVVVVLRVSTGEQAKSGAGLNAQRDACQSWADRNGGKIVAEFADEGISGAASLDQRPGLLEAIGSLESGDVLLVAKRDRLGREPMLLAMVEASVARRNARIISAAGEGTDSDDPQQVFMRRLIDAFAEYERLVIKARTKSALGAKRRRGERTGRVPFGFDLVDDGRRSKKGHPIGLVANPAEQAIIAEIRTLFAGGMSPAKIATDLNARSIPSKTGAVWSNMAVRRILSRPQIANAS